MHYTFYPLLDQTPVTPARDFVQKIYARKNINLIMADYFIPSEN